MNNYEVLYIIDRDTEETARDNLVARFEKVVTDAAGTVEKTDKWGLKKYAYPINYKDEGYYVLMTFTAAPTLPKELERQMGITDEIVRYMVVKK